MCSELLRIPLVWHGVPIFGVGVLLALWLAASGWAASRAAQIDGWPTAVRAYALSTLLGAAAIVWLVPGMFSDGVPIRGYGVMVLAGSIVGMAMALSRAARAGVDGEEIMGLAVGVFLCGVAGARLFYVVQYWDERIRQPSWLETIKEALKFTEGGLVVYGAFFGAVAAFVVYVRRRKLPALALADLVAPSLLAGLALGRIGCFLNGCCYGGESSAAWAVTFPRWSSATTPSPVYGEQAADGRFYGLRLKEEPVAGATGETSRVLIAHVDDGSPAAAAGVTAPAQASAINGGRIGDLDAARRALFDAVLAKQDVQILLADGSRRTIPAIEPPPRSRPVHPAQLYAAIDAGVLSWFLWNYYPWRRREGEVTALMLMIHPVTRFLLEIIRVDEGSVAATGLSISQLLSLPLAAAGVGLWLWLSRQPRIER